MRKLLLALLSLLGVTAQTPAAAPSKPPADVMRELRLRALSLPAKEFGIAPSPNCSRTYGVLIDFPIDRETATIVSLCDGTASLYTTSTFGIIGGGFHEQVKAAAQRLVALSDQFFDQATPTETYPYPPSGKVRFYLVSFAGVRVIEEELSAIESNRSRYAELFWKGQDVLTQLRLVTEKK